MEYHCLVGGAVLIALCCSTTAAAGNCSFQFSKQPPSTTIGDCDPYHNNMIIIAVECVIKISSGKTTMFQIRWFRENTTGAVKDLGLGNPNMQLGMDWLSRYHDTEFNNKPYSPSLLGKYWCQVINTTADPDQPLMRSNVFTLLAPGNYSGARCMGMSTIQQVDNISCADQPDNQLIQTITPRNSMTSVVPTTMSTTIVYSTVIRSSNPSSTGVTAVTVPSVLLLLLLVVMLLCTALIVVVLVRRRRTKQHQLQSASNNTVRGNSNNTVSYTNSEMDNIHSTTQSDTAMVHCSSSSQQQQPAAAIYDQPNVTTRSTKQRYAITSEYSLVGEACCTTTSGPPAAAPVLFDDPTYDSAGVSNTQYLHLENAVTRGGDTAYSKLDHSQQLAVTSTLEQTAATEYSSLNHPATSKTVDHGDSSKLAAGYGEQQQEYSSLHHHGVPAAPSDMVDHTTADQHQYSVLTVT